MGASRPHWALEDKPGDIPLREGDVLGGKYRIEEVLGRGGMGVVMAATHLALDQRVALKFLLRSAAESEQVVARFTREARAAAKIQSEHAARVLDIDMLPTGEPYMVLELLEGRDLANVLRSAGPLPVDEAVSYVLQACEALAEAHARGIVHRDLKPENLFLTNRADGSRMIKVLDFGISKVCSPGALSTTAGVTLTRTQAVIGSPLYMSPEQLRAAHDADARSDIWSLGVTLYELLAGTGPFRWNSLPELCAAVLKESPVPLRERCPELPAELEAAVLRCLEKNPDDRHANVAELAAALQRFGKPNTCSSSERAARILVGFVPPLTRNRLRHRSPLATTSDPAPGAPVAGDSPAIVPAPPLEWPGSARPSFVGPIGRARPSRDTQPFSPASKASPAALVRGILRQLQLSLQSTRRRTVLGLILACAAAGIAFASCRTERPDIAARKAQRFFSTKPLLMAGEMRTGSPPEAAPAEKSSVPDAPRIPIAAATATPSGLTTPPKRPGASPRPQPPRRAGPRPSSTGLFVDRE